MNPACLEDVSTSTKVRGQGMDSASRAVPSVNSWLDDRNVVRKRTSVARPWMVAKRGRGARPTIESLELAPGRTPNQLSHDPDLSVDDCGQKR